MTKYLVKITTSATQQNELHGTPEGLNVYHRGRGFYSCYKEPGGKVSRPDELRRYILARGFNTLAAAQAKLEELQKDTGCFYGPEFDWLATYQVEAYEVGEG